MPPSKKPEGSGISVPSGLSQRYQDSDLSKALHDDEDLDFSLPAIRLDKGAMEDEELTNLNWLHESKNLLKSFGDSVLRSVSPVQDIGDDTPPSPAHSDMPYDAKQNPNCKPPYSFSCLIFMAIEDSPTKRLPVKDIYNWILEHFPYFANAPTGWKNSVRHNLSLNKCFKKVDKDRSQHAELLHVVAAVNSSSLPVAEYYQGPETAVLGSLISPYCFYKPSTVCFAKPVVSIATAGLSCCVTGEIAKGPEMGTNKYFLSCIAAAYLLRASIWSWLVSIPQELLA
ncbi:hypothetical protein ASZ78_014732 [Callipepla squamata]|uniref:Fork-head domain-containing protein n=1 Tax=Callipepla squamata TaxID=9009 RepID=A0A226NL32_CALSU|nr:hypothetical protein ASZ78_014732 [Callipepla squamata]